MIRNVTRKSFVLLLTTVFLTGFSNFALGLSKSKSETIVIKTTIYCDHCKECESCGGKIQHDLSFDKGILHVDLDEKLMTITVKYNPSKTNPEEIRKTISKYGFDADSIKADPEGVAKLDGCCLKK